MSEEQPYPRRYFWFKRLTYLVIVILVAVIGVRLWAASVADKALKTELDRIEETRISQARQQFDHQPDTAGENAAAIYLKATTAWPKLTVRIVNEQNEGDLVNDNVAYLKSIQPALDLMRKAGAMKHADWDAIDQDANITHPFGESPAHYIALLNGIAVIDAAFRFTQQGNPAQSLRLAGDLMRLTELYGKKQKLADTEHDFYSAIRYDTCHIIFDALPLTTINDDTPVDDKTKRRTVKTSTINSLFEAIKRNEEASPQHFRVVESEIQSLLKNKDAILDGTASFDSLSWGGPPPDKTEKLLLQMLHPVVKMNLANTLKYFNDRQWENEQPSPMTGTYTAYEFPNLPASPIATALSYLELIELFSDQPELTLLLNDSDYNRAPARQLVLVALAIRLFEKQHGNWPTTLDELAPAFFDARPRSPGFNNVIRYFSNATVKTRFLEYGWPIVFPTTLETQSQSRRVVYLNYGPSNSAIDPSTPMPLFEHSDSWEISVDNNMIVYIYPPE